MTSPNAENKVTPLHGDGGDLPAYRIPPHNMKVEAALHRQQYRSKRMESEISAYTVPEFCSRHSISRSLFYKAIRDGWGPRVIKAGRRTLVSREAASEWRARMESATR